MYMRIVRRFMRFITPALLVGVWCLWSLFSTWVFGDLLGLSRLVNEPNEVWFFVPATALFFVVASAAAVCTVAYWTYRWLKWVVYDRA